MTLTDDRLPHPAAAGLAALALAFACSRPALAQPAAAGADDPPGQQKSDTLLGNLFGMRSLLARYGLSIAVQETSEIEGNPTGGLHHGVDYDGLTQATVQLQTDRAFGWRGGVFNASALQVHGRSLSSDTLLTLQTSSGIQADRATRLWELWYEQSFGGDEQFSVRLGQQSLDNEFMVNQNGTAFINTMFGWPLVPSVDLPGGGPAYPLAALGVRLRYRPIKGITLLAGAFNGSPASPVGGDAQRINASGTEFPTGNGRLYIAELQDESPSFGATVAPGETAPLGHSYKLGLWYDTEAFDDQRLDTQGAPLASATGNGLRRRHRGDYSVYAIVEQMVWREASDPNRSISVFARAMGTPQADRNLVDVSLNAGIVLHEPIDNRADDTLSLGMGYGHVGSGAAAADRDAAQAFGTTTPIRSSETFIEATYQYQLHPWWVLQPDLQYVIDPGGGIADPDQPGRTLGNELVLGLRTVLSF